MSIVGSRCTACIHVSIRLHVRKIAVQADVDQDIPLFFFHSSGHEFRDQEDELDLMSSTAIVLPKRSLF